MSTQDFISPNRIDHPRHDQNMPEGNETPVPKSWKASRPGYVGLAKRKETDMLLGNAGPNVGYAMKLSHRQSGEFFLVDHENRHDVEILIAEIAMRRASNFGRAPMIDDIHFATHLLGYDDTPTQGEEKWRPALVNGCGHNEHRRRIIVNSIPQPIIEGEKGQLHEAISGWWEKLEALF